MVTVGNLMQKEPVTVDAGTSDRRGGEADEGL